MTQSRWRPFRILLRNAGSRAWLALSVAAAVLASTGCGSLPGQPGPDPVLRPEEVLDFNTLFSQNLSLIHI